MTFNLASACQDQLLHSSPDQSAPGGVVMMVDASGIQQRWSIGRPVAEWPSTWSLQTRIRLASVTKTMTAQMVLTLVASGKLELDDCVARICPEWAVDPRTTIADLLMMTSGLKQDEHLAIAHGAAGPCSLLYLRKIVIEHEVHQFDPGAWQCYSCTNYRALADVIARISGTSFADAMHRGVFAALGMEETCVRTWPHHVAPEEANIYDGDAQGYRLRHDGYESSGDGGIVASIGDLGKWIAASIAGGVVAHYSTLADADGRHSGLGYRFGIRRSDINGEPCLYHAGSTNTLLLYLPERKIAFFGFFNDQRIGVQNILHNVARVFLGKADAPSFPADICGTFDGEEGGLPITISETVNGVECRIVDLRLPLVAADHRSARFEGTAGVVDIVWDETPFLTVSGVGPTAERYNLVPQPHQSELSMAGITGCYATDTNSANHRVEWDDTGIRHIMPPASTAAMDNRLVAVGKNRFLGERCLLEFDEAGLSYSTFRCRNVRLLKSEQRQ